jgi:CubicO group peptidase (beta-lactamase class C family)
MTRSAIAVLGVLVLLTTLGPAAQGGAPAEMAAKVDKIFARMNTPTSPGCALAVARDGRVVYARGYGMADLDHDIVITPSTVFHVASVSKEFTAAAIVLLAQDGKLSFDDEVRKYIPELPDFGRPITIRHLVHHTSGLRDQWPATEYVFERGAGASGRRRVTERPRAGGGKPVAYDAAEEFKPSAAETAAYAGVYRSEEIDATWRIAVDGGKLVLRRMKFDPVTLEPMIRDVFRSTLGAFRFARDAQGRVSGCLLTTGRVRGFRLTRQTGGT